MDIEIKKTTQFDEILSIIETVQEAGVKQPSNRFLSWIKCEITRSTYKIMFHYVQIDQQLGGYAFGVIKRELNILDIRFLKVVSKFKQSEPILALLKSFSDLKASYKTIEYVRWSPDSLNSQKLQDELNNAGFSLFERYHMRLDLTKMAIDEESIALSSQDVYLTSSVYQRGKDIMTLLSNVIRETIDVKLFPEFKTAAHTNRLYQLYGQTIYTGYDIDSSFQLVTHQDQQVIGIILTQIDGENRAAISAIAIKKEYRGQKLGEYLLMQALLQLKKAGVNQVHLHATKQNKIALSLYKKLGFKVIDSEWVVIQVL